MTNEKVISLLTKAYVDEIETSFNYMSHSINLDTFDGRDVAERLFEDIQEEQSHAKMLGERLRVHGHTVPTSFDVGFSQESLNGVDETDDVLSVVNGVIDAEEEAIDTYRELVSVARGVGDYGTARVAEELLQDEEQHLREFKSIRKGLSEE